MIEIIMNSGLFTIVITLLTIVGLITLFTWIRKKIKQPGESEVLAAVEPFIYKAIMAAYKTSEAAMDEFGERIEGADKAKIADTIYDLIPNIIDFNGTKIPIKTFISHEMFHTLIQNTFDEFLTFYNKNKDGFEKEMNEWAEENKPTVK
jgi:hypothetical protein